MGKNDDIFSTQHVHEFHAALSARSIPAQKVLVPNVLHAFDVAEEIGSETHRDVVVPAVRWIAGFVGVNAEERRSSL